VRYEGGLKREEKVESEEDSEESEEEVKEPAITSYSFVDSAFPKFEIKLNPLTSLHSSLYTPKPADSSTKSHKSST